MLRPGGRLLVCDRDWTRPASGGRIAAWLLARRKRIAPDPYYDGAMGERHATIMRALPFSAGLTFDRLAPLLTKAGFTGVRELSHDGIARAQRRGQGLRNPVYRRFVLVAEKSAHPPEYGAKRLTPGSAASDLPAGGKARCGQAGRSQILQPAPIGVAAAGFLRSRPRE